jgi:hypothetical protein
MWNFKILKIQKTFQNWSKILELQNYFTTYKWGIMYMIFKEELYFITQKNIKN